MSKIIKPVPVLLATLSLVGVLMHDMRIDKATVVAITSPAVMASAGALEKVITPANHTQVERASIPRYPNSFRSSLPNIQPPRDDDRRYIQNKKLLFMGGGDTISIWPSV